MILSHSASSVSVNLAAAAWPALFTRMSTGPNCRRAAAKASRTASARVTSATIGAARSSPPICAATSASFAASRPTSDTRAPSAARADAMAVPIPRLAPVTSACRPDSVVMVSVMDFAHWPRGSSARLHLCGALEIALELLPAGEILLRPPLLAKAQAGRGLERPGGIGKMRPRQGAKIGAAGGDDGVDVIGLVDVADRHGRDPDLVAHLVGERGLPHPAVDGLLPGDGLAGGDIDEIDACVAEGAHDEKEVRLAEAALGPIRGGDAHGERLVLRPYVSCRS